MIKLDFASFKYPASPRVIAALQQGIENINEYPDETYNSLKELLARKFGFPKSYFILGNGLDEIIDIITRVYVKENEEVIIPSPTFSQYQEAVIRVNGKAAMVECMKGGKYKIDSTEILSKINKRTKIIWICSPNNPTGGTAPLDIIESIASNTNVLVVVDEALNEFGGKSAIELIRKYDNIVVLKTFSKGYCLAGLRIGFAIGSPYVMNNLERIKQIFNVNMLGMKAAIAALEDQRYYDELWKQFKLIRIKQINEIESLGISIVGKESNFLLLDFGTVERSKKIYYSLLERGIKIFLGDDKEFTNLSGRYCRVVISTPEENRGFIDTLKRILEGEK